MKSIITKRCLMVTLCAGTVFGTSQLAGCSSPPTTEEINDQYTHYRSEIISQYELMVDGCGQAPPEDQSACLAAARAWRDSMLSNAIEGWQDAVDENWDDARERRRQLEEELEDMIPNWPDIKDLIDLVGSATGSTGIGFPRVAMSANLGNSQMVGIQPIGDPILINHNTYDFYGSIEVDRNGTVDDASCSGTLEMFIGIDGLEASGQIKSGTLVATFDGGHQATITVKKDSSNRIVTDETGFGHMVFLADFNHSMNEWDAILQSTVRVYMPVRLDEFGELIVDSDDSQIDSFASHTPFPYTDYNQDGIWDYMTDMASFLAGHATMQEDADINQDQLWDQADIDLWIMDFEYDQEHIQ